MSPTAWVLFAGALILLGAEIATTNLVLASLAVGAAAAGVAAAFDAPAAVVVAVGAAAGAVSLWGVRPALLARTRTRSELRSGTDALRGRTGTVTVGGRRAVVTIGGGEWSAVSTDGADLQQGQQVWVVDIEGATLVVAEDNA